ncbi:MAG: PD40 domain-containing protein, partial [Phycisphaerales bacterium]|nr:PD40 domain-containing protein [Phycisphaerales bacterium]
AAIAWSLRTQTSSYYTDGGAIRENLDEAPVRDILWEPPIPVRWTDSPAYEFEPHVSRDGQQLLLVRGQAGRNADLYIAQRQGDGWTRPVPLAAINSDADELGPALSPDGSTLYFHSNRAGGQGGYDLWMAPRQGDQFGVAVNLGPSINSPFDDYGAAPMMDGSGVVFSSNRPDAGADVQVDSEGNEIVEAGDYDLYIVARSDDATFGEARPLDGLNTPDTEGAPAMATRGDFLYFASDRPGGHGGFDLYRARIFDGVVYDPQNLDAPVNTEADELDPAITAEGFGLLFSSNRDAAEGSGLYFSASREVFVHDETLRGEIDWQSLWNWLWPYLLALLLLLLVLLLIPLLAKAMFGDRERLGPASLLLKCLFASVLVHFLLVLLLTVWVVATGLPEHLRPGRGTRVVLTSPSVSSGAAAQVTGRLSESAAVDAPTMESERLQQAVAMAQSAMRVEVMPNTAPVMPTSTSITNDVTDAVDTPASDPTVNVTDAAPPRSSDTDVALREMPAAQREQRAEATSAAEPTLTARDTPAEMSSEALESAMTSATVVETAAESAQAQVQAEANESSAAQVSDADAMVDAPALTATAD